MARLATAVAGCTPHNGWAILVTVAARDALPVVVDRRRVELVDPGLPSQPFHHEALELDPGAADQLIREVRHSVAACARDSLARLRRDLDGSWELAALTLREPRPLPGTLAGILASRRAIFMADSEMYLEGLRRAARRLRLPVVSHPRSGELEFASRALATASEQLSSFVRGQRKALGPPWQKDHCAAASAAIGVLAGLTPLTLPRR